MLIDEITEGTRCWKGYERKGFKIHPFSKKRVPNCVKRKKIKNRAKMGYHIGFPMGYPFRVK